MITDKSTISELLEYVCEELPEDWRLQLTLSYGECGILLLDPESGICDDFCDDDLTVAEMLRNRVNHARKSDGLQPEEEE